MEGVRGRRRNERLEQAREEILLEPLKDRSPLPRPPLPVLLNGSVLPEARAYAGESLLFARAREHMIRELMIIS